ncbi:LysE family translocator [Paractinoplanes lichenicola]|uniref:LysE family transporter n=1 Tax=Paractinoplanes lichenicola TaxID=2802976 RepID=A0ABS1VTH0_9ACTN|nr:LysE family translocator [Actinoplanes lichenicola]MBL7257767.1 LysE family transporter [Actinoplanes lichenicola]
MTTLAALWSFTLVVGLLTLTPGVDTALILRTATIQSTRSAWGVVLGIQTGTLVWGILASAGITALLTASHIAYEVVRWAGVAYLLWIGTRMLLSTWRRSPAAPSVRRVSSAPPSSAAASTDPTPATASTDATRADASTDPNPATASTDPTPAAASTDPAPAAEDRTGFLPGWRRGLLTNLLNPKMGAFYVALLPQFIPAGASPLLYGILLTGVHVVLGLAWSTVLVTTARRLKDLLRRPRARRLLDRVTGLVIVGFGVRLATEAR